jgi:polyhydroxyalkanoate synthesis repressor PhaR
VNDSPHPAGDGHDRTTRTQTTLSTVVNRTMSDTRVIKKYPNRRLYDTAISSYITLEDVKKLVLDASTFHVIDARSGEDITRTILLQIIAEQEEQGDPIFSTEVLAHIIRFYGDTLQGLMGRYLEQSLRGFVEQQHLVKEQVRNLNPIAQGLNPLTMMQDFAEKNFTIWKGMQEKFYHQAAEEMRQGKKPTPPKKSDSGDDSKD